MEILTVPLDVNSNWEDIQLSNWSDKIISFLFYKVFIMDISKFKFANW